MPGRETVDLIVHHNIGQVDIAPRNMHEMVASDAVAIAIPTGGDDRQLVVTHLGPRSHGQSPAVQGVHAVGVEVSRQIRRTADSADCQDLMGP